VRRGIGLGLLGGGFGLLAYTIGLGIYAAASTRPAVPSQPRDTDEARAAIERLGLAAEYPFAHGFVATPHGRMHYAEAGQGPVVLCLHGVPSWSFLYRQFLRDLAPDARVIAPDLIGFGLSEKRADADAYTAQGHVDDVSALVEALDLRDVTLVLQDWGAPIGLGVLARHPERVRALVVMNAFAPGPAPFGDGAGRPLPTRVFALPLVGEQLVQGLALHQRLLAPGVIERGERRSLVRRANLAVQDTWDDRAATLALMRLLPDDATDGALARFRGPALIAWGLRDAAFGRPALEAWKRALPAARLLELPDAGHYPQEDAAERVIPAVRELISARQP
jgi:haloalkane dehalogenase